MHHVLLQRWLKKILNSYKKSYLKLKNVVMKARALLIDAKITKK
jgi:hypothetical protein